MAGTAIVTGAGSGIGLATVRRLAQHGWTIAAGCFDAAQHVSLDAIAREADTAGGGTVITVPLDVTRPDSCAGIVAAAAAQFGAIDALINAAGISRMVPLPDLEGLTLEDFHAIYAVNTVGPFLMARAAADHLRRSGRGAVVNISSYAAHTGGGSSIAYAASKGALNTMTRSLARVLAPQVRVNAICPAMVEGGFVERLAPDQFAERSQRQIEKAPLGRIGQPDDVAETIEWLITGAPLITGEIFTLDCGLHLVAD